MVYLFVKIWSRITMFFFFRRIKVVHQGKIPKNASVIFAPNHQSAFIDPIAVAVHTDRSTWFLTRASVFKGSLVKALLNSVQMIPIFRQRDKVDLKTANNATFDFCHKVLMEGKSIMIFPEGNHGMQKRLRTPLKKGIGRIAFRAAHELKDQPERDIVIVPVGINYEHPTAIRTDLLLIYGEPVSVKDHLNGIDNIEDADLGALGNLIAPKISDLMVDIQPKDRYDQLELAWQEQRTVVPDLIKRLRQDQDIIKALGEGDPLPKSKPAKGRSGFGLSILRVLGFPFWLLGTILNLPWILFVRLLISKKVADPHFLLSIKFICVMAGVPLFTLLTSGILYAFTGWFWPFVALIPLTGLLAFEYRERLWKKPAPILIKDLVGDYLPDN